MFEDTERFFEDNLELINSMVGNVVMGGRTDDGGVICVREKVGRDITITVRLKQTKKLTSHVRLVEKKLAKRERSRARLEETMGRMTMGNSEPWALCTVSA